MDTNLIVRNRSILFKISFAFFMMYVLATVFFVYAYNQSKDKELRDFARRGLLAVYSDNPEELGQNIVEVEDYSTYKKVVENGEVVIDRDLGFVKVRIIEYGDELFLLVNKFGMNYLLKKNDGNIEIHKLILIGYFLFSITFGLLYVNIVRSFYPLKQLRDKIRLLKAGNFDIKIEIDNDDEIGFIAKEFNEAVKSLKRNEEIRKWFLRNIAHELKTPITKGRIAIELLEDNVGKDNFEKIFNRLEHLVNQLLLVERVSSEKFNLKKECVDIQNLIDSSVELLLISEKDKVEVKVEEKQSVMVDRNIFPVAIKNLIDNALKFSEDGMATVRYSGGVLSVENTGEKPPININLLFEPFIKETSLKNKDGLGLGLYITKFIVQAHGLVIGYKYEENRNIFYIDLKPVIC